MSRLPFLFDFISPYAYLAWHAAQPIARRHGCTLRAEPILFAGLLNHHGQKGPAEIPAKRIYVFKDALRTARLLGLPLSPPPSHPFNPLTALRAVASVDDDAPRAALVTELFRRTWGGGGGVDSAEAVAAAGEAVGLDGAALVAATADPVVKAALRARTEQAIEEGVFGVPSVLVDGELFWGHDSLGHLDRYLAGEDPLPHDLIGRWAGVRPSAQRKPG